MIKTKKTLATVMFDDGYVDNIEYAAPILKKHDCPASFYVVTGCIDFNLPTWTHIVEHLFLYTKKLEIEIETDSLPQSLRKNKWVNKNERVEFAKQMNPYLKHLSHENRSSVILKLQQYFNDVELPKIMMNWKEVKQLSDEGFSIGSHSISHAMLGTIADENEVSNELIASKNTIKKNIGIEPITISYPVGSYNKRTIELSKSAGYKIGLAVKQKFFNTDKDDFFEIPRTELYNESWFKTKMRITGTLENIKRIIHYGKPK
ncbi:MAG: polysaccharide deacetylase family protein [Bacteroidia bacterium]